MSTDPTCPSPVPGSGKPVNVRLLFGCMLLTLAVVCLSGCGSRDENALQRAAVSGSVTLDGEPLAEGIILFIPSKETEGPKATATIESGQFTLPEEYGPVVGSHRVEIKSTDSGGLPMNDEEPLERLQAQARKPHIKVVRVPAIYNKRSELSAEISDSTPNDLNFDLVSKR